MPIRITLFFALLIATAAIACSGDLLGPRDGPLRLEPDSMVLLLSDHGAFQVRYAEAGGSVEPRSVQWTSYGSAIVRVNSAGEVTGVDTGTTAIAAKKESSRGLAMVTVIQLEFVGVTAGRLHSCGWTEDGTAYCWGSNSHGQLGTEGGEVECGDARCEFRPTPIDGDRSFTAMSAGGEHSCGLSGGQAFCWGRNLEGQLGTGEAGDGTAQPVQVSGGRSYGVLAAGGSHTCALTTTGQAFCWGSNASGQLGTASQVDASAPQPVAGELRFDTLVAGLSHTCGLTPEGIAYCWGEDESGQLGNGSSGSATNPRSVSGDHRFAKIAAGDHHTCAIDLTGVGYCWGSGSQAQLGIGGQTSAGAPVEVDARGNLFSEIAAGGSHSCGVYQDGTTVCWGWNGYRQIGNNSGLRRRGNPVEAYADIDLVDLDAGWLHTCGTTGQGRIRCWGYNGAGQIGRTDSTFGCPAEEKQQCAAVPVPTFGSR